MNYGTSAAMDHPPDHVPSARIIPRAELALFGHAFPKRLGPDQDPAALVAGKPLDGGIGVLGVEQEVVAVEPANQSTFRLPFFLFGLAGVISTAAPTPIARILWLPTVRRRGHMRLSRGDGGAEQSKEPGSGFLIGLVSGLCLSSFQKGLPPPLPERYPLAVLDGPASQAKRRNIPQPTARLATISGVRS